MRRTAEFACHRPLSPAFAKLRSAQRALVRRRCVSKGKIRVSFPRSTRFSPREISTSKSTAKPTAKSHPDVASKDAIIRGNPKQGLQRKEQLPMKARRYRLSGLETETGHPDSIGPLEMAERHSQNRLAAYQAQRIPDIRLSNVRQRPYYGNVYYPKQPIATLDGTGYQKARRPRRGEILITRRPGPDDIPPLDGGSNEELPATPNQGNGKSSRSAAEKEKRYGVINPYSGPVRRSLKQQRRLSTLALIHESPSNPTLEEPASRTPSERKALHRFTTDLGRYAVAVGAEARLPAYTPTPAASQTSLNTLTDMLPYHDQFRAAGLAVTSQEQKSSSPIRGDHQPDGNSPQRPRSTSSKNVPHIHALKVPTEGATCPEVPAALACPPTRFGKKRPYQRTSSSKRKPTTKELLPWLRDKELPRTPLDRTTHDSDNHSQAALPTPVLPLIVPSRAGKGAVPLPWIPGRPNETARKRQSTREASEAADTDMLGLHKPLPVLPSTLAGPSSTVKRGSEPSAQVAHARSASADKLPCPEHRQFCSKCRASLTMNISGAEKQMVARISLSTHNDGEGLPNDAECRQTIREESDSPLDEPLLERKGDVFLQQRMPLRPSPEVGISSDTSGNESPADSAPKLPYTWDLTIRSTSSLEKALDACIQKLDSLEERRQIKRQHPPEAMRKLGLPFDQVPALPRKEASECRHIRQLKSSGKEAAPPSSVYSVQNPADYHDYGIKDRDVLLGLKMAVSAACDENLDACIRTKTGLRLRRFLADLKVFEGIEDDGDEQAQLDSVRKGNA